MAAEDPNRYSWQGVYSWSEPSLGSRLDWRGDPWRFLTLGLIPLTIFSVAGFCHLGFSLESVAWLGGVSAVFMVYVWLNTFFPRLIRLFEDKVIITRAGRSLSGKNVYYANIRSIDIVSEKKNVIITLNLKAGGTVVLVSPDNVAPDRLRDLFEKAQLPNHKAEPVSPSRAGSP